MQIETVTVSKCKGVWLAEFSQPPGMVVRQEFKGLFWTLFQSSLNLRYSGNHNFLFWCILTFTFTAVLLRNAGTFLFCHLWPGEKFRLLHCQIQWFCVCVCAHAHTLTHSFLKQFFFFCYHALKAGATLNSSLPWWGTTMTYESHILKHALSRCHLMNIVCPL